MLPANDHSKCQGLTGRLRKVRQQTVCTSIYSLEDNLLQITCKHCIMYISLKSKQGKHGDSVCH